MTNRDTRSNATRSLGALILSDLKRYRVTDQRSYFTMFIICPGVFAGIVFRLGHWIWTYSGPLEKLVWLLRPPFMLLKRFSEILTGIHIQPRATIGEGLYIDHSGSIFIGGDVVIGNNCNITHEVTIGIAGRGEKRGMPTLGDRVLIGAGAKLIGRITIGSDVAIGANAVVTHSVPDRAVVVGIPAHVLSYYGSFDFVFYEGMDADPSRRASLERAEILVGAQDF